VAKTKPIPVRVPTETLPRLDAAAARLGTNRARLIAFCVKTFLDDFEAHGKEMMPLNWKEILARLDGRTKTYGPWHSRAAGPHGLNENGKSTKPANSKT
jgi:hypothetical protein